jgi:hypothetical protein
LYACDGEIENNTIVHNAAAQNGGGTYFCRGFIRNCILWGNTAASGPQLYDSSEPAYSCIQGWSGGGLGNIAPQAGPGFADPDGPDDNPETFNDNNYRLASGSPCIDAGLNTPPGTSPGFDLENNLRIAFGGTALTVDMGCYEFDSGPLAITGTVFIEGGGFGIQWRSQPNESYVIWTCGELCGGTWTECGEGPIPSAGASSYWFDGDLTCICRFYRIEPR